MSSIIQTLYSLRKKQKGTHIARSLFGDQIGQLEVLLNTLDFSFAL